VLCVKGGDADELEMSEQRLPVGPEAAASGAVGRAVWGCCAPLFDAEVESPCLLKWVKEEALAFVRRPRTHGRTSHRLNVQADRRTPFDL
jgi:hypothetical protein